MLMFADCGEIATLQTVKYFLKNPLTPKVHVYFMNIIFIQ